MIGENELVDQGFDKATQWPCLYDLWQQESGWNVYAENPSGAYGIPQSLPGDKMASAGADWQTEPDDADHLGPRLHQIGLRHAVCRVAARRGGRVLLIPFSRPFRNSLYSAEWLPVDCGMAGYSR